jgi:hypothetical protein
VLETVQQAATTASALGHNLPYKLVTATKRNGYNVKITNIMISSFVAWNS